MQLFLSIHFRLLFYSIKSTTKSILRIKVKNNTYWTNSSQFPEHYIAMPPCNALRSYIDKTFISLLKLCTMTREKLSNIVLPWDWTPNALISLSNKLGTNDLLNKKKLQINSYGKPLYFSSKCFFRSWRIGIWCNDTNSSRQNYNGNIFK